MNKNNQFTKNTVFKVVDFIAEAGASRFPGGTIAYSAIKNMIGIAKNYHDHKVDQKIQQFHLAIFSGENREDFLNKEFNLDYYTSLLKSCLQDIEDEKTVIYGKLLKGLLKNAELSKDTKKRIILLINELTINDILILKKIYIYLKYNIGNNDYSKISDIKNILNSQDAQTKTTKNRLAYYSLIDIDNDYIDEFIITFLETIFDENELTPENIGLKEWRNMRVWIISFRLNDPRHIEIATKIENTLYQERISSVIAIINERTINMRHMYSAGVLIFDNEDINEDRLNLLNKFAEKLPLFIVSIGESNNKSLPKIRNEKIINLNYPYDNLQVILSDILTEYL
jgi:hypothetical protein